MLSISNDSASFGGAALDPDRSFSTATKCVMSSLYQSSTAIARSTPGFSSSNDCLSTFARSGGRFNENSQIVLRCVDEAERDFRKPSMDFGNPWPTRRLGLLPANDVRYTAAPVARSPTSAASPLT